MRLKDKVCIITGMSGNGRSMAEQLLMEGALISIFDLDSDNGELCAEELQKYGKNRVIFCHCDVTDYSQFEESFQLTKDTFGKIDVLVNNAEIQNDKFWELEVDVNLNGIIRGTLLAYQFMSKEKGNAGGTIVNIGSLSSSKPFVSSPIYTATKHAILGLTKSYGDQYHYNITGIRVICYCIGPTESDSISHSRHNNNTPNHERARKIDMQGIRYQKLDHVGKELIDVLLHASTGSLWLVKNDEKAKEIPYSSEVF